MNIELPYNLTLRPYQKPFWQAMLSKAYTRALVVWPRRNGKDLITLNILVAMSCERKGVYFYMAPFYTQVRSAIWNGMDKEGRRFLDYIPPQLIKRKNSQELIIELINGSIIRFCGSDNIDSIVGNNPVGIVFTEFSLHKPEAWHYLRPILAENGGWAIFNGTPRGLNHFFELFEKGKKHGWFIQFLTRDDTGVPTLEAIEEDRQSGMPESLIQQEYYCSWTSSSEEKVIPLDIIEPCLTAKVTEQEIKDFPRIMGVDVAFAALGDKSVITKRQGRMTYPQLTFQGLDNMGLATQIVKEIKTFKPDAIFIDAGRGEGVISRLTQLGFGDLVVPVNFGGKPESDAYANKATEMWYRARDYLLSPAGPPQLPNSEELIKKLSCRNGAVNDVQKLQIESKAKMKIRGITSLDEADSFVLTFAEDVDEPVFQRDPNYDVIQQYMDIIQDHQYDMDNHLRSYDYDL